MVCWDRLDRPHRADPESPDELLAMIQFAGTPALQEALRALCMEFNRYLLARVQSMVMGAAFQQTPAKTPFR